MLLLAFRFELGTGTRNGEPLVIEKLLNSDYVLHVRTTIGALAGVAFGWLELRKLSLPETQDVSRQAAKAANLSNAEVELIGNNYLARVFARGILGRFMHEPHGRRAAERILSRLKINVNRNKSEFDKELEEDEQEAVCGAVFPRLGLQLLANGA